MTSFSRSKQQVDRHVEEIAGAAGRVEHRDVREPLGEVAEQLGRTPCAAGESLGARAPLRLRLRAAS